MSITDRLERLERQNRWMRRGLTVFVVVLAAGLLMGQGAQEAVPDVIRAKAFQVVSDDGDTLVSIGQSPGGYFGFPLKSGTIVGLGADDDFDGLIQIFNSRAKEIVRISATDDGDGALTTYDARGGELVELGVLEDRSGAVTVLDPSGRTKRGRLTTVRRQ